jgi:ABC-type branched-subunit amino acid transport system permease subunit
VVKTLGEATKLVAVDAPGLDLVIYGCVLILIVAFAPSGIAGLLRKAWQRITAPKSLQPEQSHG